jgi:hypothetical protein
MKEAWCPDEGSLLIIHDSKNQFIISSVPNISKENT